jgi:hypothetical protein
VPSNRSFCGGLRSIDVAISVVVLATLLVGTAGCSTEAPALTLDGTAIQTRVLAMGLDAAEQRLRTVAAERGGVVEGDLRCWAEHVAANRQLTGRAHCGPVSFPGAAPTDSWAVVDLELHVVRGATASYVAVGWPEVQALRVPRPADPSMGHQRPGGPPMPSA